MIETYKILHQIYDQAVTDDILTLATEGSRTWGHSLKLFKKTFQYVFISCGYPMELSNRGNCFRT